MTDQIPSKLYNKKKFEEYYDYVGSVILVLDRKGSVSYINKKGCSVLGLSKEEIIGKNWVLEFIPESLKDEIESLRKGLLESEDSGNAENENPVMTADGSVRLFKWSNNTLWDEKGKATGIISSGEDITERLLYEKELEKARIQLTKAEEIALTGSWIMDIETGEYNCSDGFLKICGFDPENFTADYSHVIKATHPDDIERIDKIIAKSIRTGKDYEFENRILRHDGEVRHVRSKGTYIKDGEGRVIKSMGTLLDITDLKEHYEKIEYMNRHDSLTGLLNRQSFDYEYEKLDCRGNYPISILVADINGLKMVNDTKGHAEGDRLIMEVSQILSSVCEKDDVLARTGGDDFIILMPKTVLSQAEILMAEIHELLNERSEENLSVSMGLAVKNGDDQTKEDVIKEAEDNMYTSKLYEKASKRGDMLQLIMDALYERSKREKMHSERVSMYCSELAAVLRMPKHKINELSALGLLHDIGKIAVKDSVLNKPGRLTDEEWEEIKRHPETGFRILNNAPGMLEASKYILAHHERWDGSGYPNRLSTYDIPLQARIIAIADAFDAMRSKRPYKEPLPLEVAINELKKGAGKQFDPEIVKVFVIEVLNQKW